MFDYKLLCTSCDTEKLSKDFPPLYRAKEQRPWRYCEKCVIEYKGQKKAKFTGDITAAIADYQEK